MKYEVEYAISVSKEKSHRGRRIVSAYTEDSAKNRVFSYLTDYYNSHRNEKIPQVVILKANKI